ncbi:hypothetical protein Nepgr_031393 [Nepenthes gracilis]|uniref:TraB domain-containing protein n=1 Tax=Nepenthes gracilis TaxID=150966 RepID=A0AAD3Y6S6_NEPGR|nr:hypothetical protein Nepgr_031393 [Nepenthes gracilis]
MKAVSRPPQTIFVPRKPKLQISTLNVLYSRTPIRPSNASIKPPPADFDFRSSEVVVLSRSVIADSHPELLDLADRGSLVLVQKRQFGRVPSWRAEFVEPEEIWVMGTTHISQASSVDVERVGRALRPDNVVVELCRSRAGIMYASDIVDHGKQLSSNMFSLSGTEFFRAVHRSINLGGQTALALRLLLALFSSKLSSDVSRPFGDEFRAARRVSEEVGAQIVLGDRPIEITLERAWNSLKWFEKLGLVVSIVCGITSSSNEISKESSADDSPLQLYDQLSFSYPSLVQPLICERDMYLAWSLKRSKAVNNSKRVLGVIGKGHMNGVIYALISDQGDLQFRDLVGERRSDGSSGWLNRLANSLARDTLLGILLWTLFEHLKS